jgi:hypothetical protein
MKDTYSSLSSDIPPHLPSWLKTSSGTVKNPCLSLSLIYPDQCSLLYLKKIVPKKIHLGVLLETK